ncbi:hypothetical protein [Methylocella silvestris]|uniref:hypothetical protein n=1 Tax=Methylocella silvestris TaxID=199596 RepID=UPI0011D0D572|nr:hypothetical protein [Methylocella silvestris]
MEIFKIFLALPSQTPLVKLLISVAGSIIWIGILIYLWNPSSEKIQDANASPSTSPTFNSSGQTGGQMGIINNFNNQAIEAVKEKPTIQLIKTSVISTPNWARYSGLDPDPTKDSALFDVPGVFISNTSLTKSVTVRLKLVITDDSLPGSTWEFDGSGEDLFRRKLGKNDLGSQILKNRLGVDESERLLLSPLTLAPQQTRYGSLPFIIQIFFEDKQYQKVVDQLVFESSNNRLRYKLEIKDVISGQIISVDLPGQLKGE